MKYYFGIDLGGMSAKAGLMDTEGNLLYTNRCETLSEDLPVVTAEKLARLAKEILKKAELTKEQIAAVGIGSPGVIDSERGVVIHWSNFHWNDVPLAEYVERELGLPVFVTNDANAAALGEAKYGSGKGFSDSVMLTLGTGIGGGIVIGGKLFEGYRSAGGELGHTVIRVGGLRCSCGRRGCFECYASATALKRETRSAMTRHGDSLLWQEAASLDEVTGMTVFRAAERGDVYAKKVIASYLKNLGEGIVNIVNLFRPQIVIIGGGISNQGDALLIPLKRYVLRHIYAPSEYAPLEIAQAKLGNDAGIYGAAAYAIARAER